MTACIVGWSHLPFGKHEGRSAESLIVEAATAAIADAGLAPADDRRDLARPLQRRLRRPGLHQLARAPGRPGPALQARDPGRERLRHRLRRRAPGPARDRGQGGADRAGGRRREDDRARRPGHRRDAAALRLRRRGEGHRGRLRRRVRPDRAKLLPAPRRPIRRAGRDRRQEPQERLRQPLGAAAQGSRLRILPERLGQEPDRRRPAQAHRLLAGLRRCRRPGAGRRRDRTADEARPWPSARGHRSTTSCR